MIRLRLGAVFACSIIVLGACGSHAKEAAPSETIAPTTSVSTSTGPATTAPTTTGPKGDLEFREVVSQYPWAGDPTADGTGPGQQPFPGCAKLIEDSRSAAPSAPETVLPARDRESCYVVGPVLVDAKGIDAATVIYDSTSSQWATNVHFANDDFLDKIAGPLVNKMVAIVFDGVVQSAPTINPGITGHDVEITGDYTKYEAIDLAAAISGVKPERVKVDDSGDAPD